MRKFRSNYTGCYTEERGRKEVTPEFEKERAREKTMSLIRLKEASSLRGRPCYSGTFEETGYSHCVKTAEDVFRYVPCLL
jgi:hypothetical protein